MPESNKRSEYISGLRKLADTLEQHDELDLPQTGTEGSPVHFSLTLKDDPKEALAQYARALPCRFDKETDTSFFNLDGKLDGLHIQVYAWRSDVCERIVTGTRTVSTLEADPEAVAALPKVERTSQEEIVEWKCPDTIMGYTKEKAPA